MARSVPAAVPGLCDMVPRGVVPRRGTAHAWRCQATPWDVTPRHVTCCVPRCAMCYTVPCHVPRRDVPRPVPCRVPRPLVCHAAMGHVLRRAVCHVPSCAMCRCAVPHPVPCHIPCRATSHAVPRQARSHPTPCCHPPCAGEDNRHSLAAGIQPLSAHRHPDTRTQPLSGPRAEVDTLFPSAVIQKYGGATSPWWAPPFSQYQKVLLFINKTLLHS